MFKFVLLLGLLACLLDPVVAVVPDDDEVDVLRKIWTCRIDFQRPRPFKEFEAAGCKLNGKELTLEQFKSWDANRDGYLSSMEVYFYVRRSTYTK